MHLGNALHFPTIYRLGLGKDSPTMDSGKKIAESDSEETHPMPWLPVHKLTELAAGIVEPAMGWELAKGLPNPRPPNAMLLTPRLPIPRARLLEPLPPIPVLIFRARSFARLIVSRSLEEAEKCKETGSAAGPTCFSCQLAHLSPPALLAPSQSTGRGSSSSGRRHGCARTESSPSSSMSLLLYGHLMCFLPALALMIL